MLVCDVGYRELHNWIKGRTMIAGTGEDLATVTQVQQDQKLNALVAFTRAVVRGRGRVADSLDLKDFFAAGYTQQNALEVLLGVAHEETEQIHQPPDRHAAGCCFRKRSLADLGRVRLLQEGCVTVHPAATQCAATPEYNGGPHESAGFCPELSVFEIPCNPVKGKRISGCLHMQ